MGILAKLLGKLPFGRNKEQSSPANVEELRTAFRDRYHSFKVLLAANNKALEIMAEMEEALRGARPFGMSFVRANATAVLVNVFRIVKNLDQLAPRKYHDLFDQFKAIQGRINEVLSQRKQPKAEKLVLPFEQINMSLADQVGSKMANLGEVMNRLVMPVPAGFVITSLAYQRFFEHNDLQTEIDRLLQASEVDQLDQLYSLSADIQQLIIRATVPPDLQEAILAAYQALESKAGEGVKVSMRSSALGEDLAGASFAGQYRSQLNVSPEDLIQAYKEIVASKYSLQAIAYRLNRGILDEDIAMCVGCMVMVNAAAGGGDLFPQPAQHPG
jgi:pyruvate, water dikinase